MTEIWKPVLGFEDTHLVSDLGRVKPLNPRYKHVEFLKPCIDGCGYQQVVLCKDGKRFRIKVHRIVMETFVGKSELQIDHLNNDRQDNRLSNLEYVTARQNVVRKFNRSAPKRLRGAYKPLGRKLWTAQISVKGKKKFIGNYETELEAHNAYVAFVNNIGERHD